MISTHGVLNASYHRASASHATTATRVRSAFQFRDVAADFQSVVDEEFLIGKDVPSDLDKDAIVRFNRLAVWFTCVVEPPCTVPPTATVDDAPVGKPEVERMSGLSVAAMRLRGCSPRDDLSLVLEQQLARLNRPQREHTPSVNARPAHGESLHLSSSMS